MGTGAYLISGGANGAFLFLLGILALAVSFYFITFFLLSSLTFGTLILAGISYLLWYDAFRGFLNTGKRASALVKDGKLSEADKIVNINVMILSISALGAGIIKTLGLNPTLKLIMYDITTWLFKQL